MRPLMHSYVRLFTSTILCKVAHVSNRFLIWTVLVWIRITVQSRSRRELRRRQSTSGCLSCCWERGNLELAEDGTIFSYWLGSSPTVPSVLPLSSSGQPLTIYACVRDPSRPYAVWFPPPSSRC